MKLNIIPGAHIAFLRAAHSHQMEKSLYFTNGSLSNTTDFSDSIARLKEKSISTLSPNISDSSIDDLTADQIAPHQSDWEKHQDDLVIPLITDPASATISPVASTSATVIVTANTFYPTHANNRISPDIPTRPVKISIEPSVIIADNALPLEHQTGIAGEIEDTSILHAADKNLSGNQKISGNAHLLPANKTTSHAFLSGDMHALVSEFETSIHHFERAGNRWIGNASITFQSVILGGASIQITGNEKSLNILLTQSALSPVNVSLYRQEKQLSDALTRRLGRCVTLHIVHTSERQMANNAESQ